MNQEHDKYGLWLAYAYAVNSPDPSNQEEIAEAAAELVMEHISFGWEEVEADDTRGGEQDG